MLKKKLEQIKNLISSINKKNNERKSYFEITAIEVEIAKKIDQIEQEINNKKIEDEIREFPISLLHYSSEIINHKPLLLKALKLNANIIEHEKIDNIYLKDKDIALVVCAKNGSLLKIFDDFLKKDKEVVQVAVKNYGLAIFEADESFLEDKEIIISALEQDSSIFKNKRFSKKLKKDIDIAKVALNDPTNYELLDKNLKNNEEAIILTLSKNYNLLNKMDVLIANNEIIMSKAIEKNVKIFMLAGEKVRNNKDIAAIALDKNNQLVAYLGKQLIKEIGQEDPLLYCKRIALKKRLENTLSQGKTTVKTKHKI